MSDPLRQKGVMPVAAGRETLGRGVTPAERARIDAGFGGPEGLARMARRLRVSARYARQAELHGGCPYVYMERATHLLGCDPSAFDIRATSPALRKSSPAHRKKDRSRVGARGAPAAEKTEDERES